MNGRDWYNEIDPFAAAWLRELIADGLIPTGDVDERDIRDVLPSDLVGYRRCHFFAGVAGWAEALRLAEWPDDRPVWTGSCPCQSFSAAGRGGGFADERHLWPAWFHLIRECQPPVVFGEQVEAAVRHGWLDLVFSDLEGEGYACGATVLGAHSVGAPHIRQRLWFVADSNGLLAEQPAWTWARPNQKTRGRALRKFAGCGDFDKLANAGSERRRQVGAISGGRGEGSRAQGLVERSVHSGDGELGDTASERRGEARTTETDFRTPNLPTDTGHWSDLEWLPCRDGKARPAQRRFQSMDDGLWPSMVGRGEAYLAPLASNQKNRVGMLRGAGNAIVPQVAAEVIRAHMASALPHPAQASSGGGHG